MLRPALPHLRCGKNGLNVEAVPGCKILADAPDFVDDRIADHKLFSHQFFRCADDRTLISMLPADQGKCPGVGRVREKRRNSDSPAALDCFKLQSCCVNQTSMSQPVEKLKGGISRFQSEVYPEHQDLFEKLALGQRPDALFITCADSRIDPCLLTQTKPGELFICRVIGNIVPPYPDAIGGVSATVEYATGVLRVPAVIVCGHTDCGVMKGALNPDALEGYPNVQAWLRYAEVEHREPEPSPEFLLALTERNVVAQLKNLRSHPAIAARLAEGDLALHGWVYDIGTGAVTAWDEQAGEFHAVNRTRTAG